MFDWLLIDSANDGLIEYMDHGLINWLTGWLLVKLMDKFIDSLNEWLIGVDYLLDKLTDDLFQYLNGCWLIEQMMGWLIAWFMDWLTDWLIA